jgi:hypothetical protein
MSNDNPSSTDACRGRISIEQVGRAVAKLDAMNLVQKEQLAEEIAREQPALLSSFLAQKQFGVSYEKMEFLLNILFVCYLSMTESGLNWPRITDDDADGSMNRYVESVQFGRDLDPAQRHELVIQFIAAHPEQALLAYVQVETANWLRRVTPEDSDRFVMLAAANIVNCIGYVHGTEFESLNMAAKTGK